MATVFDQNISGSGDAGSLLYVDLGLIPNGLRYWLGKATYYTQSKQFSFELRSNTTGNSAGTDAATSTIDATSVKAGATVNKDLYQRGRLHKVSNYGTGVERLWLKLKAKSATLSYFEYSIDYTME